MRSEQELFHILSANLETPSGDAGYDLKARWLALPTTALHRQCAQMLHAGYFVSGCAIVLSDFRLYHHFRIILIRHDEIGRLVETIYALRPLSFTETDPRLGKNALDGSLQNISD